MKKLLLLVLATSLSVMNVHAEPQDTAPISKIDVGSKFAQLKNKFDETTESIAVSDLFGTYSGVCYRSDGSQAELDSPVAYILTMLENIDEGPDFLKNDPSHYKLVVASVEAATAGATLAALDQYSINLFVWGDKNTDISPLTIESNVAKSVITYAEDTPQTDTLLAKKGNDGYLYTETNLSVGTPDQNPYMVCYFWKKLF